MAISPRLGRKFQQTLGTEAAEDLVHWMDHVDAQSEDVRALVARVSEWRDTSRAELGAARSDLRSEIATLGSDLRSEIAALGGDLRAEIAKSHADLIKWSFVFWATTLGAVVFVGLR